MELTLNIKKIFITVLLISMGIRQNVVINFRDNGDNTFNVDYINDTENKLASFEFNVDSATVDNAHGGVYTNYLSAPPNRYSFNL